jgi:hypothetical protein
MAYPYNERTRPIRRENHGQAIEGSLINGTISVTYNLPPGMYATGYAVQTSGNTAPVVFKVTPWVDHAQTLLADSNFKFLKVGATTATTNVSLAATTTHRGQVGMVIPAGDQYGAAAPVMCVHGFQIDTTSTAAVGTYKIHFVASEI